MPTEIYYAGTSDTMGEPAGYHQNDDVFESVADIAFAASSDCISLTKNLQPLDTVNSHDMWEQKTASQTMAETATISLFLKKSNLE